MWLWPFKKCAHELEHRRIYGDEIHMHGGQRDIWKCRLCGRQTYKLPSPPQTDKPSPLPSPPENTK